MMEVNGLTLPAALVQAVNDGRKRWMFKALLNAYGDETDYLTMDLVDFEMMREQTGWVPGWSSPNRECEYEASGRPGWLPFIHDVSRLVVFGEDKIPLTFCLDFRDNGQEPAVICRTYNCWRRVAPSFSAFMELLEPYDFEKYWQRANEIVGHRIPAAFAQLCEAIRLGEAPNEWKLKEDVDAYGSEWDAWDLRLNFTDPLTLKAETDFITHAYLHEDGFQEDFPGVDNFVWFGSTTDGMIYGFDFGTDPNEPSVVYWDDGLWREVAPNFETFIALFIDSDTRCRCYKNGVYEEVQCPSRTLLAVQARWYVRASQESFRRFFADVGDFYEACSVEERREAEAEVREQLERQGMTDEQRRRLDELWDTLRSTGPATKSSGTRS